MSIFLFLNPRRCVLWECKRVNFYSVFLDIRIFVLCGEMTSKWGGSCNRAWRLCDISSFRRIRT